jgi:ZIP family zinc transporter
MAADALSTTEVLALAAIAGGTIFLGLPLGRISRPVPRLRAGLNAGAIGVLVFLLFDVLAHANEPVETALLAAGDGNASWARFGWLASVFAAGTAAGLVTLVYYDRRRATGFRANGSGSSEGRELAVMIAVGIGLHNLSEGLAIGQSAASGETTLALLLIVGFGLHNATEGFGIVAPLTGEETRPSWGFLALMGLIGGGPTFVGTVIGQSFVNDTVFLLFLALAAGSILYVVMQLVRVASRLGHPELVMWCVFAGLAAGFATDYVLVAAGG